MTEEIKTNIEKRYPELIVELDRLNLHTAAAMKDIYTTKLYEQGAERLKIYTRFLSLANCTKTSIYLLHKFVCNRQINMSYFRQLAV
jgi:hypothetical protein